MSSEEFDVSDLHDLAIEWIRISLLYKVAAMRHFSQLEQLIVRARTNEDKSQISEILGKLEGLEKITVK